jgi:hypothetical protein
MMTDLRWNPCSKTPAGRRTPEVLRPCLVACSDGKASDHFLFEVEDGKPHGHDWIRRGLRRWHDLDVGAHAVVVAGTGGGRHGEVLALRCVAGARELQQFLELRGRAGCSSWRKRQVGSPSCSSWPESQPAPKVGNVTTLRRLLGNARIPDVATLERLLAAWASSTSLVIPPAACASSSSFAMPPTAWRSHLLLALLPALYACGLRYLAFLEELSRRGRAVSEADLTHLRPFAKRARTALITHGLA